MYVFNLSVTATVILSVGENIRGRGLGCSRGQGVGLH